MKRWVILQAAVLLLGSVAGCVNDLRGGDEGDQVPAGVKDGTGGGGLGPGGGQGSALPESAVAIRGYAFEPATLRVTVGTEVRWGNLHDVDHAVSSVDGGWSSGNLAPGENFTRAFGEPGTFRYVCPYHPEMVGTLVVLQEGGGDAPPEGDGPDDGGGEEPEPGGQEEPATDPYPVQEEPVGSGNESAGEDGTGPTVTGRIEGFEFSPATLRVEAGTTVVWTNLDSAPHTVTDEEDAFDSGYMAQGDEFAYTFTRPGTYEYRCEYHSSMRAVVVVS